MHQTLSERWNRISLRTKITGVTVLMLTLGLLVSGVGTAAMLRSYVEDQLEAKLQTIAEVGLSRYFEDGTGDPRQMSVACDEEVRLRVPYGKSTLASVDIVLPDGTATRIVSEIMVRDVLIAGMGDSVAAGEGNPDRPVRLSQEGFCFQRFLGGEFSEYYRPNRAGYSGNRSCVAEVTDPHAAGWARQSARWQSGPCHRLDGSSNG